MIHHYPHPHTDYGLCNLWSTDDYWFTVTIVQPLYYYTTIASHYVSMLRLVLTWLLCEAVLPLLVDWETNGGNCDGSRSTFCDCLLCWRCMTMRQWHYAWQLYTIIGWMTYRWLIRIIISSSRVAHSWAFPTTNKGYRWNHVTLFILLGCNTCHHCYPYFCCIVVVVIVMLNCYYCVVVVVALLVLSAGHPLSSCDLQFP